MGVSALGGSLRSSSPVARLGGQASGEAAGHPFAASMSGMMGFAVLWAVGSIRTGDHARWGS